MRILPAIFLLFTAAAAQDSASQWLTRFSVAAEDFTRESDSLREAGFRPVSVDLEGSPAQPRFSAAWTRDSGAPWILLPPAKESEFQKSVAAWADKGFIPIQITALDGPGGSPGGETGEAKEDYPETVYAAVLEKDSTFRQGKARGRPEARILFGLDRTRFQAALDSAQKAKGICAWVDVHGTASHPLFSGLFRHNAEGTAWNYSIGDDESGLHRKMNAFAGVWVRPAFLAPIPGARYFTLWHENSIGPWAAHASLDEKTLRAAVETEAGRGLYPIRLQAGSGRTESAYTVLLAGRDKPLPRQWTVTGPEAPAFSAFDGYMRELMRSYGVRSGALAMARDGKLAFAHGYTWAEEGYPLTGPNSLFRVASCSKPLTSIMVHRLVREGGPEKKGLSLKEKILSLLKPGTEENPVEPADERFRDITVDQLLTHSGGWVRSREHPDPVFNDFPIGSEIRNRLPASRKDFLAYMLGQPLQFNPGSRSVYDNFGYFLLGRLIESLPMGVGKSYETLAGDMLFRPLGLSRPRFGGSRLEERVQDEVLYHTSVPYLQKNPQGGDPIWVPGAYGDFDLRNMDAAGAWLLSAPDYAKVLAAFDLGESNPILNPEGVTTMWAPSGYEKFLRGWFASKVAVKGDTVTAKWHNGLYPGTSTLVFYRPDKWSFALFLNRDIQPQLTGERQGRQLSRLADAVGEWPRDDLFPELGIPAFPRPEGMPTATAGP